MVGNDHNTGKRAQSKRPNRTDDSTRTHPSARNQRPPSTKVSEHHHAPTMLPIRVKLDYYVLGRAECSRDISITMKYHQRTSWRDVIHKVRATDVVPSWDSQLELIISSRRVDIGDTVPNETGLSVEIRAHMDPYCHWARHWKRKKSDALAMPNVGIGNPPEKLDHESDSLLQRHFFRHEDSQVWKVLVGHAAKGDDKPLALLGSPGCGKSSMARLLALQMSCTDHKDVIILHCVVPGHVTMQFYSKDGSRVSGRLDTCSMKQLLAALATIENRLVSPFVIIDGFAPTDLLPWCRYNLFVTSGAFNQSGMGERMVLLPSWSAGDVLRLQQLANVETRQVIHERYTFFGGDLRNIFSKNQEAASRELYSAVDRVDETTANLLLSTSGRSRPEQVDRLRRFRVLDPSNQAHYTNPKFWVGQVESLSAHRALIRHTPLEWYDNPLRRSTTTDIYGNVYEMTCHKHAEHEETIVFTNVKYLTDLDEPRSSARSNQPVAHSMPAGQGSAVLYQFLSLEASRITVETGTTIREGKTNHDAMAAMRKVKLGQATYWYPDHSKFPAIDAVVRCTLQNHESDSGVSEKIEALGLLQYTVGQRKVVDNDLLKPILANLTSPSKPKWPIVLIYVSPPGVDLKVSLPPEDFPTFKVTYDALLAQPRFTPDRYVEEADQILGRTQDNLPPAAEPMEIIEASE